MRLIPLYLYILVHLKRAGIDYAKSISKNVNVSLNVIVSALEKMVKLGIIERTHGSAIKRTEARFKLSYEVRKHHTYYKLTNEGEKVLRKIKSNINDYFKELTGFEKAFEVFMFIIRAEYEHAGFIAKSFSMKNEQIKDLLANLIDSGLIEESKPKVLKKKHRKAKPKKETRTQHKYYRATRLGKMLVRYLF
ncbi:DUF2250 domain-containing protein [Archaeoglobales archaeon]|nr:MAG: DUF2250 domain-containing protein [Archaeoglobales archaeon]